MSALNATKKFLKFLYKKPEPWHSDLSLDERRLTTPTESGRYRLAIAQSKGKGLKGRGREVVAGMKGWRPSLLF
jgi:hypothetical protein